MDFSNPSGFFNVIDGAVEGYLSVLDSYDDQTGQPWYPDPGRNYAVFGSALGNEEPYFVIGAGSKPDSGVYNPIWIIRSAMDWNNMNFEGTIRLPYP